MPITPEQFKNAFTAIANLRGLGKAVAAQWAWDIENGMNYSPNGLPIRGHVTTHHLTSMVERAVPDIAGALGLQDTWGILVNPARRRGPRLDAVLFSEADDGARTPEVAWEHKNDIRGGCTEEIRNLNASTAPLRVLVTYPRPNQPRRGADYWLTQFGPIVAEQADRQFVVVFGMDDDTWRFYRHMPAGFKEMP